MSTKFNNFKKKARSFLTENKSEFILLSIILLVGSFLRLYRISQYMTFLGDEGRDMILIRRIFTELHPPLIGPGTSVGGMYLGPLYYYLMAIPLLIASFSPVGPSVAVALVGVATIILVWVIGRKWFSREAGLIAAALYATSPTVIHFSRSSWNPNVMPFFALLSVYGVWKAYREHKFGWLIVMGISFAFVLQSHYLGLILAPTLFLFWLLTFKDVKKKKNNFKMKKFLKNSLIGLLSFLGLMSPLLIFDLRHDFINSKAMIAFFTDKGDALSLNFLKIVYSIPGIFDLINTSLLGNKNAAVGLILSLNIAIGLTSLFVKGFTGAKKKKISKSGPELMILIAWLAFGLIGLGIYQKEIYDHYFGFLFPVPFLLISAVISEFTHGKTFFKILGYLFVLFLLSINLMNNPFSKDPNRLLARSIHVAGVIEDNSGGEPFNLAVIADTNYEDAYKYFLLKDGYPVVSIDSQIPGTITDQLFVVCELIPVEKCDPTHSPKAEVANFGWSRIVESWEVDGTMVYRLVHSI